MKTFAIIFVIASVAMLQTSAQVIRIPCGNPAILPAAAAFPLLPSNAVASNLADTLSLLTVSSLLSEKLPYGPNVITSLPVSTALPYAAPACGCAGGYGWI